MSFSIELTDEAIADITKHKKQAIRKSLLRLTNF